MLLLSLHCLLSGNSPDGRFPVRGDPPPPPPPTNLPPEPDNSPPVILEHPAASLVAAPGEPATLTCGAAGRPTPRVEWWAVLIGRASQTVRVTTTREDADSHRIQLPDGSLFFLEATAGEDAGVYWCVARNHNGVARSRNATLEIACKEELIQR